MQLHNFSEEHIKEDCRELTGLHENGLFFGCSFEKLRGLSLKDCDLNRSKFLTESVRDALGFTLTLSCLSFRGVEYSPLLFDLMLSLMVMSKGNDEKRKKILEVIGADRAEAIQRVLGATE